MDRPLQKPRWRGRLHQAAFFVSVPAGVSLVLAAHGALARVGAAIYAVSLSALFGTSAAFHRGTWGPRGWLWMRRLDHSMIFLLIAGTYTPYALLGLSPPWSTVILAVVWGGGAVGAVLRLATRGLPRVESTLYIVLGWVALFTLPLTLQSLGWTGMALLVAGGLLYTVGAAMFALGKPDPRPEVFGYHEVWHSMVIGASLCHFVVIATLVVRG